MLQIKPVKELSPRRPMCLAEEIFIKKRQKSFNNFSHQVSKITNEDEFYKSDVYLQLESIIENLQKYREEFQSDRKPTYEYTT